MQQRFSYGFSSRPQRGSRSNAGRCAEKKQQLSICYTVPAKHADDGLRALSAERAIRPESIPMYPVGKFGEALKDVLKAMRELAKSLPPPELAERAYALYDKFRPEFPPGKKRMGGLWQTGLFTSICRKE